MRGFYFITDSKLSRRGNYSDVKSALRSNVEAVQYRAKDLSTKEMFEEALLLRRLCRKTLFLVNDRLDIALGVLADGVHLGSSDLPYREARRLLGKKKVIGMTVHSLKEAIEAERLGADYLGVGPIFSTGTKPDAGEPLGAEILSRIKKSVSLPLVAIGGITLKNAHRVIACGADSLAAISAVVTKADVKSEIGKYQRLFGKGRE